MSYKFFENKDCEFYPCHNSDKINCLFCYCPLYFNYDCGGKYEIIEVKGIEMKDCSNCTIPHNEEGYDYIVNKLVNSKFHKRINLYNINDWISYFKTKNSMEE